MEHTHPSSHQHRPIAGPSSFHRAHGGLDTYCAKGHLWLAAAAPPPTPPRYAICLSCFKCILPIIQQCCTDPPPPQEVPTVSAVRADTGSVETHTHTHRQCARGHAYRSSHRIKSAACLQLRRRAGKLAGSSELITCSERGL